MTDPTTAPGAQAPVRVLLVDDDALVRTGLALILGGSPELDVVGEAGDGAEGVEQARRLQPDVVLLDIRMPRMDGIAATSALLELPRPPRVLVLTTFDADDLVLAALRAGAAGFLLKDTPPAQMVAAVRAVARGERPLSPSVTDQVIRAATSGGTDVRRSRARASLDRLTVREREVAEAIGRGLANADIAAQLFMSVATVKAHVSHILDKLGVENRVQIALLVHDAAD